MRDRTTSTVPNSPTPDNGPDPSTNGAAPAGDLFTDLSQLRLSQDYAASCGVKKTLLALPVRKPAKEWFIRTNTGLRLETFVLELKEERETYLVDPKLWRELAGESMFGPRALCVAMTRQNVLFLWPIRLPGPDGRIDDWNRTALEAATLAEAKWIRVVSNQQLGAYDVFTASGDWPEPDWPDIPLNELLRIAFKGKVIESLDHSVLRRLRGEV